MAQRQSNGTNGSEATGAPKTAATTCATRHCGGCLAHPQESRHRRPPSLLIISYAPMAATTSKMPGGAPPSTSTPFSKPLESKRTEQPCTHTQELRKPLTPRVGRLKKQRLPPIADYLILTPSTTCSLEDNKGQRLKPYREATRGHHTLALSLSSGDLFPLRLDVDVITPATANKVQLLCGAEKKSAHRRQLNMRPTNLLGLPVISKRRL
jgi:hypothetical protein